MREFLLPELHDSAIERLWRSEVVNNVLVIGVVQQSELPQLGPGDLQRREEVDPLHGLGAGRCGEGPLVGAVLGGAGGPIDRSHGLQQVNKLAAGISNCRTTSTLLTLNPTEAKSTWESDSMICDRALVRGARAVLVLS